MQSGGTLDRGVNIVSIGTVGNYGDDHIYLSQSGDLFLLDERFTQESLENYIGKQRSRGRQNDTLI